MILADGVYYALGLVAGGAAVSWLTTLVQFRLHQVGQIVVAQRPVSVAHPGLVAQ